MKRNITNKGPGQKTHDIKRQEAHITWAIDFIDQTLKSIDDEGIDTVDIKIKLKKLRKEISKL